MTEVGFGLTGMDWIGESWVLDRLEYKDKEEVSFDLTLIDWNKISLFWIDWNVLDWRKLILDRLKCNVMEEVTFGLTVTDWNDRSWFWINWNRLDWRKLVLD
jgi:hypothetical protein